MHGDDEVANCGEAFDTRLVTVYDCEGPQSFAAPFHVDCYEVLGDASHPQSFDLSALYDTFESYCPRDQRAYRCELEFDYNAPKHNVSFTSSLPNPKDALNVANELTRKSQKYGKQNRSNARHMLNGEKVSTLKIYADMPWAKYTLPRGKDMQPRRIDRAEYYKNLDALGNGHPKERDFTLPVRMHLQNRCRIWGVCTRLLEECSTHGLSANKTKTKRQEHLITYTKQTDKILEGAISSPMPLLTFPAYFIKTYASASLIKEMNDLEKAKPVIRVYWTARRELAGIGVYDPDTNTTKTVGSKRIFHTSRDAQIPPDDWLVGIFSMTKEVPIRIPRVWQREIVGIRFVFPHGDFIQLGESVGDARVLVPKPWHAVVGIGATWAIGSPLESLVLLQWDQEKVPQSAHGRVGMEYHGDLDPLSESKMFLPDPRIANFLWRGRVPCRPEIWPIYPVRLDPLIQTPVETLMLTRPDIENWDYKLILGFGDLSALPMDDDERITKCYITGKEEIESIRFVTDRTQHFIAGRPGPEEKGLAKEGGNNETIEGFHCRWSDD
ncbi:hypothetical protein FACUT_7788 [Fusarium acutatum]|uniref:Uncharacterized protein n=1 Tax=Fusarium acutatum TaxID=78861 RepID=A0A8H4NEK8_9HYPO|nr:hypothetical protein FACUT_7788 [Fusarium acutatum]